MKTQIFVMTHKKFDPPQDAVYVPLHVGRALGQDLGYMGDDTGNSISHLNPYYGELTGLYWLWKNYHDVDIVGICHYRRYFLDEQRAFMTKEQYEAELEKADVLVSNAVYAKNSYKEDYANAHNLKDLIETGEVIKKLYPNDYAAFCEVIDGKKYYYGNLCVMRKELFDSYCEWLFGIFSELEKHVDVSGYDDYHKRLFGFLSEGLLFVYITARGLRVTEGKIGVTSEKAETIEFKLAMSQLVKMGRFREAREMFYEYIKVRPDVQLEMSDVRREIPEIELILYILEQEEAQGLIGFYGVSQDLKELIVHLRKVREIVSKAVTGMKQTQEDVDYLEKTKVTELAQEIIRINL